MNTLILVNGSVSIGSCSYWKNDFNEVSVTFGIEKSGSADDITDLLFATLPAGFRPKENEQRAANGYKTNALRQAGFLTLEKKGTLAVSFGDHGAVKRAFGEINFIAND